ncbi:MAG: LAGLIDADG family homing endonuclease [Candidatus Bathyarchaeia archaeon]
MIKEKANVKQSIKEKEKLFEQWLSLVDIDVDFIRTLDAEKRKSPNPFLKYLIYKLMKEIIKNEERISTYRIAEKINNEFKLGKKKLSSTIYQWLTDGRHPLSNIKIPRPSCKIAQVICATLGDGAVAYARKRGVRKINFSNIKDLDFVLEVKKLMEGSCGGTAYCRKNKLGYFDLDYDDSTFLGYLVYIAKKDPLRIGKLVQRYPRAIRGLFDAEGCVNEKTMSVTLVNRDERVIALVSLALSKLRIHHVIRLRKYLPFMIDKRRKKIYSCNPIGHEVYIRRCCLKRFKRLIGFSIKRKQETLEKIIKRRETLGDERHKIRWCPEKSITPSLFLLSLVSCLALTLV